MRYMNEHVEKAMAFRNEVPMISNCAQAVLRAYAPEIGMSDELALAIGKNFGRGMKCGETCGAITGALMVLGALGLDTPNKANEFRKRIADKHNGMTRCADLLRANAQTYTPMEEHCNGLIVEAIEAIDEMVKENQ